MKVYFIAPEDRSEWFNKGGLWESCYNSWVDSSFDTVLLNDDSDLDAIISEHDDPAFVDILNSIPKITKIDYVRFVILHKIGGIYADMDLYLHNDFKHLLKKDQIYISGSGKEFDYCNSLMISPADDFWRLVKEMSKERILLQLDELVQFEDYPEKKKKSRRVYNQSYLTGAHLLFDFVKEMKFQDKVFRLDPGYFNREAYGNPFAYTVHYQTGMWRLSEKEIQQKMNPDEEGIQRH